MGSISKFAYQYNTDGTTLCTKSTISIIGGMEYLHSRTTINEQNNNFVTANKSMYNHSTNAFMNVAFETSYIYDNKNNIKYYWLQCSIKSQTLLLIK
ncbi:hypothetical protein [Flavobacterium sp.]|uniref:hypothetical protein n=1 Tax=Flavobacterium sp. TaxID=239 RepID=UPI00286E72CC|nr:hypothetical protein [Flavobacterium sp.]